MHNAISNFCAEMYLFPERVTNVYDLKLLVHTLSHQFILVSPIYDLHKSMWIDSLWIKCLWPQTTCTYTISRVYIGNSHLWLLHKSMCIEKTSLWIKCLWHLTRDRKTLRTKGLRHRKANVTRVLTVCITQFRIFARKCTFSQSGSQMFMTSNYLYIHYLTSLYWYLPFMICIKVCESTVCESNVYDLKLLVHTLSHEFI